MPQGRSLELFFIEGKPDGMRTAEVFNWTGHVLFTPRLTLKNALQREYATHTGVYVLLGEKDGVGTAYIGESEELAPRLRNHAKEKDWWTHAVLVCTTADTLNKAHVKYLESRLVEIARSVGAVQLENGNTPTKSSLHEAGRANMEEFLETLQIAMPALGVDIFTQKARTPENTAARTEQLAETNYEFVLRTPKHGVEAFARLEGSDLVVRKGSVCRGEWTKNETTEHGYKTLHNKLIDNGTIEPFEDKGRFTQDYAFNSPSAAAAVLNGRRTNGRIEWRTVAGNKTFAEWEDAELTKENET
ncbi:GIY-YIG nuclease family protein [Nereida sp. MMG025]|uniref:GIY-YIG nuclease family protein n=1 Tax=Nereida sp. MMG025 TaxID=2909981 RepID=UPI001F29216B|nr:GIY-YIG nuclease family protein [Nereida sp. MMG025]MCF6443974.1 GIY-YIG nuclease family protein [Nereida sp. MMG025]